MSQIAITLGNESVGSVSFVQPYEQLTAQRTASGFRLQIPASLTLLPPTGSGSPLLLENLRATFSCVGDDGQQVEIGHGLYSTPIRTTVRDQPISLSWDWTLPAFAFFEGLRAGKESRFRIALSGDIRYILSGEVGREPISIASSFFQCTGEISYLQQIWTGMMRKLDLQDSILVEIPFAAEPPTGWEPIWTALQDARNSFDSGGSTGWKGAATSVRLALEEWRKIEPEDRGPSDPYQRTKPQRIDNIRLCLIQLAHFAAHTKADEWTRDDALLMLSTVCALLNVKKP